MGTLLYAEGMLRVFLDIHSTSLTWFSETEWVFVTVTVDG